MENINILGSHNSWTYLKPKKWWLHPFKFMSKCQSVDIKTQYEKYGVRCFDLRVRFKKTDGLILAHGMMEYNYRWFDLAKDLQYINSKKDCYVRVLHEVRNEKEYTIFSKETFVDFCKHISSNFKNIKFWCGKNLYNWEYDYNFGNEPSCEENYSSVKAPKFIDDWCPWLYAKLKNKKIIKNGSDKDILLIDFVNIR